MRFLCLHGMGTNSKIFEMQTAAIRYGLGNEHSYEFIDGAVPAPMAPGLGSVAVPDDEFLQYVQGDSLESGLKALHDLERLVDEEGPFDGVMAFSQGAALAASLIVRRLREGGHGRHMFQCAIFFCGGVPYDVSGGVQRELSAELDGELIQIPTAHIWGANDSLFPTFGPVLSKLCKCDVRADFVHNGGHEIPGAKDQEAVLKATQVIKRAIERARLSK